VQDPSSASASSVPYGDRMPIGQADLTELVRRLATKSPGQTEANVQADLHTLLVVGGLNLGDAEVNDVVLETSTSTCSRSRSRCGATTGDASSGAAAPRMSRGILDGTTGE
jgi:hypothetical protein